MHFQFVAEVASPIDRVFAFFERPRNLEVLHRDARSLRVIVCADRVADAGQTWIEQTVCGILPVVLGFEHRNCDPPRRFEDHLIHGPFQFFRHVHAFESRDGSTTIRDTLEVRLKSAFGGETVTRFLVAPALNEMFRERSRVLKGIAADIASGRFCRDTESEAMA